MKWEMDADIRVVQGCIERARDIIEANGIECSLAETAASRIYTFTSSLMGDLGSVKLSVLPQDRTELYGYSPSAPTDTWLTHFLPRNITSDQLGEPLSSLLALYAWQLEHQLFGLKAAELYRMGLSGESVDMGWERFGLGDAQKKLEAVRALDVWRAKLHKRRDDDFAQILGLVETEIRFAAVHMRKWEGRHVVEVPVLGDLLSQGKRRGQPAAQSLVGDQGATKPAAGRRGRKSQFSQERRDQVVSKWEKARTEDDPRTLDVFLVGEFGDRDNDSIQPTPIVSRSTFYVWRKDYLRRYRVKKKSSK